MNLYTTDSRVLIVGAGCFGISTAYHLLKRGFRDVTVIDRSEVLPAPDAASSDINKVVRSSYADRFYTELARDAIREWKNEREWGAGYYHECGVLFLGSSSGHEYSAKAYENDAAVGCRLSKLDNSRGDAVRSWLPVGLEMGPKLVDGGSTLSFINWDGGWVNATAGISHGVTNVIALGGKIVPDKHVKALVRNRDDGQTSGVECADGTVFATDLVIIAAGSWTPSVLGLQDECIATGQSTATIELTPDEADRYRHVPILIDHESGFYIFPPNGDNIIKFGIHGPGYTHKHASTLDISTPRTVLSHGDQDGLRIPKNKARELRNLLCGVYPELGKKAFVNTRLCWYADTPDTDWIIGFHPTDKSLLLATGGSGHAYKFFPVIGKLVADVIEGVLPDDLVKKFAVRRPSNDSTLEDCRKDSVSELDEDDLCTLEDLLP